MTPKSLPEPREAPFSKENHFSTLNEKNQPVSRSVIITIGVAAICIILAFLFLPWRRLPAFEYAKLSGYRWFWIMPLLSLIPFLAIAIRKRIQLSAFVAGITPFVVFAVLQAQAAGRSGFHDGNFQSGAYLIFFSGVVLLACSGSVSMAAHGIALAKGWLPTRKVDVLDHWFSVVPNFELSPQEFYDSVEKEIASQRLPGFRVARIDFFEGTFLTAKRFYLRLIRDELVFDVCACPCGTNYFFSYRLAQFPRRVNLFTVLAVFSGVGVFCGLFTQLFGTALGLLTIAVIVVFTTWFLRNAIALGLSDFDGALVRSPIIGPLYDRCLRRQTYYREDTRLMYLQIVSTIVKGLAADATAEKGVKLVPQYERTSILGELYKLANPPEPSDSSRFTKAA